MKPTLIFIVLASYIPACLLQGQGPTTNNPSPSSKSSTSTASSPASQGSSQSCINLFDTESAYFYSIMNHFNGLFFGDFTTFGNKGIYGPLAVGGTANIPLYSIDKNIVADCNSTVELDRLGFTSNFLTSPASLYVAGDVITGNQPDYNFLVFGDPDCSVKNESSAPFQFDALWSKASYIGQYLANQPPTHRLVGNSLQEIAGAQSNNLFHVLQFGPCSGHQCQAANQEVSDASQIFLGDDSWTGPKEGYPENLMVVFNIGIVDGENMIVTTGSPNAGLSACRALFNFYSVNPNDGAFGLTDTSLTREGDGRWGGVVMNLWGDIIDGPQGNFGGQVIGINYKWQEQDQGADIFDFFELGETCTEKSTCWLPVYTEDIGGVSTTEIGIVAPGVSLSVQTVTETVTDTSYDLETDYTTETYEVITTQFSYSFLTETSVTSTTTTTITYETTTLATSTGTRTSTATSTITLTVTAYDTDVEDTTTETTTTTDVTIEDTTIQTVNVTDHETQENTFIFMVTDTTTEETTEDIYTTTTTTDLTSIEDYYTTTTTTTIAVTTYTPAV